MTIIKPLVLPFLDMFHDKNIPKDILFFSFILILIPLSLITGPAIPDIFISFIALYFLIKSVIFKIWKYYKNFIFIFFISFVFYSIVVSITSEFSSESLSNEGSVFYFRYIFFALGVWYLLDNNHHISRLILIISISSILIVTLDGFYQYFNGVNVFGNEKFSEDRLTGFFNDEPIIGRYISLLSLFSFGLIYLVFEPTKKVIFGSVLLLTLSEVLVFLSGERAPFFYIFLFSIIMLVSIPKFRIYRIFGILISISIIFLIMQIDSSAKNRIIDQTIQQVSETKLPFLPYSEMHEQHYISALKMFNNNKIFGIGINSFRFNCEKEEYKYKSYSCTSHPHNYYIQTLAELGIFGFIFIFSFFIFISYLLLKNIIYQITMKPDKSIDIKSFIFIVILFVYWWPIIPHMSFYNNWNNVLIMLPLGFFMREFFKKKFIKN